MGHLESARFGREGHGQPGQPGSHYPEVDLLLDVLEQAKLTIWAADNEDADFAIRLWNRGAELTYGYPRAEAVGKNYVSLFVNPNEQAQTIEAHRKIVETGREYPWNFAANDIAKDGTIRTVLGSAFRVWDRARQRYICAEVGIDVANLAQLTQQTDASRHLTLPQGDARRQLKLVRGLEALNGAIASLDQPDEGGLDRVVVAIRQGVHLMLSSDPLCRVWMLDDTYTPWLAGESDDLPGPPSIAEAELIQSTGIKVISGGEAPVVGDSDEAYRSVVAAPLQFGVAPRGVLVMFFRDAAPLTEDDRDLLRHFASYAAVAIEMAGMAREQQRRRYEETERIRHAIIESVLHTVGNEAGLVKLAADSLTEKLAGGLAPAAGRDLTQIQLSAGRLGQIMGELIRQGNFVASRSILNLAEVVRVVTRAVERDHYDRIILQHQVDLDLFVEASEYLLREAVGNLVRNAIQAMVEADGGGELRLSADCVERDWNGRHQRVVMLDVEDSGPGVQPDFRHRIWELGFSTRGDGHGHGLYHTEGLVRMLGGAVKLMEEPSALGGARFRVFMPAAPND